MNNKNIAFSIRIILALFLAIQVWVWLRYAGAFWLSDSLAFMKYLVESVSPLKTSIEAFLILVVPALAVSFAVHRSWSMGARIAFYVLLASLYSTLYFFFMAKSNLTFIARQVWVYLAAGGVAGLAYGTILEFLRRPSPSPGDETDFFQERRKLLGSLKLKGPGSFKFPARFGLCCEINPTPL